MKQIKVRCTDPFQAFSGTNLLYEVKEGEELTADLYEETEEYFATDSQGREVYVGCLDMDGNLVLQDFELVEEGADKHE
ncbi:MULTISPECIES: hypothetical protein [unclassified Paenibacillus]|uniref:hypothetical protein n=1 Tax=unclassified Paenibacillus TaxID=185978 RepID=UPI0009A5AC05|nr:MULTISPECIES: hypothetical protein [unclassified Paenibacillus]SLJ98263.1 hypothetical protein SAMN06272722_102723 [Paenibacillus sp. RU5A]SOC66792.1 hypothetical protein SAMN05880581_102274 [Paenibacillus sp. RU26A]SOC70059.1 hypothetical protein SAMN05880586_102723 [Paenibacillus sp. RU5M]